MQGIFTGTGAADFFHLEFCQEEECPLSRQEGGRSLRSSSGFLLEDTILFDASWSAFEYFQKHPQAICELQAILITHSHDDHFLPPVVAYLAEQRYKLGLSPLRLLGNQTVISAMNFYLQHSLAENYTITTKEDNLPIELVELTPFRWVQQEAFQVLPLPANHAIFYSWEEIYPGATEHLQNKWPLDGPLLLKREDALNYFISYNGKKMFYGLDSAWPLPETMAELVRHQLDLAILDATFGFKDPLPGHMNFNTLVRLVEELDLAHRAVASHLSLHWVPAHTQIEPWLAARKIKLAYDGMKIDC
jgi:phosphoribosyl 1,2-cyclic phosphate phosphodiesterase